MKIQRTLHIMLQVNDPRDENVDTQAEIKSEPPPSVRMIQSNFEIKQLEHPVLTFEIMKTFLVSKIGGQCTISVLILIIWTMCSSSSSSNLADTVHLANLFF